MNIDLFEIAKQEVLGEGGLLRTVTVTATLNGVSDYAEAGRLLCDRIARELDLVPPRPTIVPELDEAARHWLTRSSC